MYQITPNFLDVSFNYILINYFTLIKVKKKIFEQKCILSKREKMHTYICFVREITNVKKIPFQFLFLFGLYICDCL